MSEQNQSGTHASRLATGAVVAAGIAGLGLLSPNDAKAVTPALTFSDIPGTGDVKVLNYALALEALETDMYTQAYFRLTTGFTNALGTVVPGLGLTRSELDVAFIRDLANVEKTHREFLNGALGSASVLKGAFANVKFDFNIQNLNRKQVDNLVYNTESTGLRAYLGAIPFLATKTYLQTAGAIQGVEARHATQIAVIINTLFSSGLQTAPLATQNNGIDQPLTPDMVLAAVSPYIVF